MAKPPKKGETVAFDFAILPPKPVAEAVVEVVQEVVVEVNLEAPTVEPPVWVPPPLPEPPPPTPKPEGPRILTVAQLGRVVGRSLERTFADKEVWVEGEVSGARPASSGHVYFALKDENEDASIDVVLYRSSVTPRGRALVKDGARIKIRGKPTYWSPRGKLQFVGDRVEPTGKGALLEALEKLKEKLQAEGLFAAEKKRPLPHDPRIVGVVTSASGAVIHDICKVAFRRGGAHIMLASAQVQGPTAVDAIRRALRMLQRVANVDVIVIGRGGGSAEDLAAFNDEFVVRDVAACRVPIVSAVGHEVDITLVDFAADARAATPSQAAEMIVPDQTARRRLLEERTRRLERAMRSKIAEDRAESERLLRAFGDPRLLIASAQQRIDDLTMRLGRLTLRRIANEKDATLSFTAHLRAQHPHARIARDRAKVGELANRLAAAGRERTLRGNATLTTSLTDRLARAAPRLVRERTDSVAGLAGRLDAMSPLKVLARGYAIVTRDDGRAVREASEVTPGERLHVRVGAGKFDATVTKDEK